MSSAKLGGHAAPCSSPRLAQEQAAARRSWGRPSACWAGPEENMKMDGQPENDNNEHERARRQSKRPNKMPSVVDNGFIADFLTRLASTLLVIMFDFSSNSQRACSARAFLFLRESAVPDRRWVRRVRPLMANRDLSRQGSQHSPYVLAKKFYKRSLSLSLFLSPFVCVCVSKGIYFPRSLSGRALTLSLIHI